ncbi:LysR family transcriptional regulator [Paraburkholderia sediminicola]|uniref:LysR family transcriptional regulator n=1 Tax=Paraburkholderia sediminicola TaxID=458836 RepID=UPI0038B743F1
MSPPTLSQQIRQLEDTLRVQLLDRSGRAIQVSDAAPLRALRAERPAGSSGWEATNP